MKSEKIWNSKDICNGCGFDELKFERFLIQNYDFEKSYRGYTIPDFQAADVVKQYRKMLKEEERRAEEERLGEEKSSWKQSALKDLPSEEELKKQRAISEMLITSGFTFDGYRIVKYSGYISGDDVAQIGRDTKHFAGPSNSQTVGKVLTNALVKSRRQALEELKEAAYNLGCNAVIGLDFDYITLDPVISNIIGSSVNLPFVFCVTANGNAVVIEKIEK